MRSRVERILRNLRSGRLRVVLNCAGVALATAALTVLSAYGDGFGQQFSARVARIGKRVVYLFPGSIMRAHAGAARVVDLSGGAIEEAGRVADVEAAGAELFAGLRVVRRGARTKQVWVYGVTASTAKIRSFEVSQGRFFSEREEAGRARVAFLAGEAARRLFPHGSPVGARIMIDNVPFEVVGVAELKGDQVIYMGPKDDEIILIPLATAQQWLVHDDRVSYLTFMPREGADSAQVTARVRAQLGLHGGFAGADATALQSFDVADALSDVEDMSSGLSILLHAAGLITLAVAGGGVGGVMLISVAERRQEIGVLKALGARTSVVVGDVIVETVAITVGGALLGVALGGVIVAVAARLTPPDLLFVPRPELAWRPLCVQVAVVACIGLAAAYAPARQAARVMPSMAVREVYRDA